MTRSKANSIISCSLYSIAIDNCGTYIGYGAWTELTRGSYEATCELSNHVRES